MMQARSKDGVAPLRDVGRGLVGACVGVWGGGARVVGDGIPRLLLRECDCMDSGRLLLKLSIDNRDRIPFFGDSELSRCSWDDTVGLSGSSAQGANGGGRLWSNIVCLNSRGECVGVGRRFTPRVDPLDGGTGDRLTSPWYLVKLSSVRFIRRRASMVVSGVGGC